MTLAKRQVEAGVHARTTQDIVQQIQRNPLAMVNVVRPVAHHDMCLMRAFLTHNDRGVITVVH